MPEEQDPKRWFADGFSGRWKVNGDLAAKIQRRSATLIDARIHVEKYVSDALKHMEEVLDLKALESFSDDQIKAECGRRGIDFPFPEAPDA